MRNVSLIGLALAFTAFLPTAGVAQEARYTFYGALRVTAVSKKCLEDETVWVGAVRRITFDRDMRSSEVKDSLRMTFYQWHDFSFLPVDDDGNRTRFGRSGRLQSAFIFSRGVLDIEEGSYSGMTISPATITAATEEVRIKGRIKDFDLDGCIVSFEALGVRRP